MLGSQVTNWSKKIGKLMRKPRQKIRQRSVEWFHWDVPAISRSLHMSRICFPSGAFDTFLFYMNLVSLGHEGLGYDWKQSMRCSRSRLQQAADHIWVHLYERFHVQGKPRLGEAHAAIPKPLGQDKPWLELALGWISREHRFCTIYTGCSRLM